MIKLSDFVFKYLAEQGVQDVFMLSGGGCMHLVDSVGRNKQIKYTCCLHEQVAALAAGAYAQYKNQIGVALVTTGPGGTNAVTGVAAAFSDSIPLVMISGQVKRADMSYDTVRTLGFQELPIVDIVKPITKYAKTVLEPMDIKKELQKAIYMAKEGRPGPVWIDIPLDVQASQIDETILECFEEPNGDKPTIDFKKIIQMLNESSRPVILAGYGIKMSGCEKEFQQLINKLEIPVLTTWKALDLLDGEFPLFFGRPGNIGQRCANFIQQTADLIITIGARLDFGQIGYEVDEFAKNAKKIIVDVDVEELNKFKFNTEMKLNCDAGTFVIGMLKNLDSVAVFNTKKWREHCKKLKEKYPVITDNHRQAKDGVSTYYLMELLSQYTDEKTVFAPGNSGASSEIFMQAYKLKRGQRVVTTNTLGSMGTGLPSAIGTCIASGEMTTICVNGEGGFMMNVQDLETIKRLQLPIKFFVLNNNGYGSIRNTQHNYFGDNFVGSTPESGVTIPDLCKIAASYEINSIKIYSNVELKDKIKTIIEAEEPFVCEIMVDSQEKTLPRTTSVIDEKGNMKSKPLEDLFPFLDRAEFEESMRVE